MVEAVDSRLDDAGRCYYPTAFVTDQGVAHKYGCNHRPLRAEIRGTFVEV